MSEEKWLTIYFTTVKVCAYLMMVLAICGAVVYCVSKCGLAALLLIIGAAFMGYVVRKGFEE